jgi:ABC-2 type transport system ATP-binding protein
MLKVSNISKSFGNVKVLTDISFQIQDGEIYGLIGYNGVGKTTLMKIICGIYRPDSGKVWADKKLMYENPEIKSNSFFMTEEISAFSQASLETMRKFYRGYYPCWSDTVYEKLLGVFHMEPERRISQFSKGMQRQAGLILAFAANTKFLLLDEAFDGLDFGIRRQIREMMKCYAKGKNTVILISSHNLSELEELADKVGMISEGKMIYNNSTMKMREQYQVCRLKKNVVISEKDLAGIGGRWVMRQAEEEYYILPGSPDAVKTCMKPWIQDVQEIRPIKLEEFFQKERKAEEIDWNEIFEI